MKQMPVESFFACVGKFASRASRAHMRIFRMSPSGNSVAAQLLLAQCVQEVGLVLAARPRARSRRSAAIAGNPTRA